MNERGQATVEFALTIPILMLVFLALIQTGIIAHGQIMVTQVAREGARQATTAESNGEIERAARQSAAGLRQGSLNISYSAPKGWKVGEPVTVIAQYDVPVVFPAIKGIFGAATVVQASTTMRIEKERS